MDITVGTESHNERDIMNKSSGEVLALFISKKEILTRISRTTLNVDKEGIVGDKFFATKKIK